MSDFYRRNITQQQRSGLGNQEFLMQLLQRLQGAQQGSFGNNPFMSTPTQGGNSATLAAALGGPGREYYPIDIEDPTGPYPVTPPGVSPPAPTPTNPWTNPEFGPPEKPTNPNPAPVTTGGDSGTDTGSKPIDWAVIPETIDPMPGNLNAFQKLMWVLKNFMYNPDGTLKTQYADQRKKWQATQAGGTNPPPGGTTGTGGLDTPDPLDPGDTTGGTSGSGGTGDYVTIGSPNDFEFLKAINPATGKTYFDEALSQLQGGRDYAFQQLQGLQGQLGQAYNPMGTANFNQNQFMQNFLASEPELARVAQDRTSALGQSLEGIAQRQSRLGGEAALAAMPGARNSGAAMAAFGEAYASPFAQAQAQTQAAQLGLYQGLAGQSLGQYGSNAQFGSELQKAYDFQNAANQLSTLERQQRGLDTFANMMQGYDQLGAGLRGGATQWYQPTYAAKKGAFDQIMQGVSTVSPIITALLAGLG